MVKKRRAVAFDDVFLSRIDGLLNDSLSSLNSEKIDDLLDTPAMARLYLFLYRFVCQRDKRIDFSYLYKVAFNTSYQQMDTWLSKLSRIDGLFVWHRKKHTYNFLLININKFHQRDLERAEKTLRNCL